MGVCVVTICLLVACNLVNPKQAAPGQVQVLVDRAGYADGDTIVVTIDNGLDSLVTTVDHRSFCWIAQLQLGVDDGWQDAGACFSMQPAQEESIEPGGTRALPVLVMTGTDAYPAVTRPGTYRWRFVYSTGGSFSFSRAQEAFSPAFAVQ